MHCVFRSTVHGKEYEIFGQIAMVLAVVYLQR